MHSWKGLDISSEGSGISPSLSRQVNLLGTLLGHVIRDQAGEDIFQMVEELRILCKESPDSKENRLRAQDLISGLNNSQLRLVLRSFTTFFRLINLAEQQEIIRINRGRAQKVGESMERAESLGEAVWLAKKAGLSIEQLLENIAQLNIQLTLTPHPTEARRRSILLKQQRIADLLAALDNSDLTPIEEEIIINDLYQQILLLYLTDEIRGSSVSVEENLNHLLHFASTTFWKVIPLLYEDLQRGIRRNYEQHCELPAFLHYRSWIGGDRDGKASVTAAITARVLQTQREAVIDLYCQELQALQHELSISTRLADIPGELADSLNRDLDLLGITENDLSHLAQEPYRRKVEVILKKLEIAKNRPLDEAELASPQANYQADDFIADIDLLCRNLAEGGMQDAAQQSSLSRLGMRARTFGFHFLNLDIKQNSLVHEKTLTEVFRQGQIHDNYGSLGEEEKITLLTGELLNPRPMLRAAPTLSDQAGEVLHTFHTIKQAVNRDNRSIYSYIISNSQKLSDMLEVLVLAKEAGLWHLEGDQCYSDLHLVPMFETISELEQGPHFVQSLCQHPIYRKHLMARGSFQEVMLGYSESAKDGGIFCSKWTVQKSLSELANAFKKEGIRVRFHHGQGSSIERGGGLAKQAIHSLPHDSVTGEIRFTEQGEVISFRYAQPAIARRHLEQIVNGMLLTLSLEKDNEQTESEKGYQLMERLATDSKNTYRRLVENEEFWFWYTFTTPIEHITDQPLSTHPGEAADHGGVDFYSLKSNLWNFAWLQTRYNLPTWYGLGTALTQLLEQDPEGLEILQKSYLEWPFFQTLIENLQQELARVRLELAHCYTETENDEIHQRIEQEFRQITTAVLLISGNEFLLSNKPVIAKSIALRNPYIDVLNLIQVELIKRWRNASGGMKNPVLRPLLLSINGIAAAMQSTG